MFTIKVLVDTLPGGYEPILAMYNANRPPGSEPIYKAGVCEGGFEIPLNAEERAKIEESGRMLDPNDYVRQLRWNRGKLQSGYHKGFTKEETELLYLTLVSVLGENNVQAFQ